MNDEYKNSPELTIYQFDFKDGLLDTDMEETLTKTHINCNEVIALFYSFYDSDIDFNEKKAIADKISAFIFLYPQYYGEIQNEHLLFILNNLQTSFFAENSLRALSKILQTLNDPIGSKFYDQILQSSIFENLEIFLSRNNDSATIIKYTLLCILHLTNYDDSHILTKLYEANVFEKLNELDIRADYEIGLYFLKFLKLMIVYDYHYDIESYDTEFVYEICLDKGYDAIQTGENNYISEGLSIIINGFRGAPMFPYIFDHSAIISKIFETRKLKIQGINIKITEFLKLFLEMGEEAFDLVSGVQVIPFVVDLLQSASDEEMDYLLDLILTILNSGQETPVICLMDELVELDFAGIFNCMSWETKIKFLSIFPRILSFICIAQIAQFMTSELISFFGNLVNSESILICSDVSRILIYAIDKSGRDPNFVQAMTDVLAEEGCLDALEDVSLTHHENLNDQEHIEIINHFLEYHRSLDGE